MNILVHTWWFSAEKGSEFSVAYNFVKEMAGFHRLFVAVESCSYAWNDLSEFEHLKIDNVEFIFVPQNWKLKFLLSVQRKLKGTVAGWFSYALFHEWEKLLYKKIKREYCNKIDVIHYLGPVGWHEPGYLYKLKKPYIWGPAGGFENANNELVRHYYDGSARLVMLKSALNTLRQFFAFRAKKIAQKSAVVIAATHSNLKIMEKRLHPKRLLWFPENLMRITESDILPAESIEKKYDTVPVLRAAWIGACIPRKMPNLLLDAVRQVKNGGRLRVNIAGDPCGFDKIAAASGLSCVQFLGKIPRGGVKPAAFRKPRFADYLCP